MKAKDAFAMASKIDKELCTDDPRFERAVKIIHDHEGTVLFFENAFVQHYYDWVFVFTEHHGHHVYNESDVRIFQYERIYE